MIKKILAIIFILAFVTSNSAICKVAQSADSEDAFAPSKTTQEQTTNESINENSAQNSKISKINLKFWDKKKNEQIEKPKKKLFSKKNKKASEQKKEKDFTDAKKYAEEAYKNKLKEEKEIKKASKKKEKNETKKTKQKETKTQEQDSQTDNTSANSKNFENEIDAQITDGKRTVQGSVSTNRIISVDDCVKIALENNPTIVSLMMTRDIYKNQIAQAWSNYFPTINAGVSYSKMSLVNEANTLRNIPIREAVSMSTQQLIDHVYGYSESKINIFQNNVTSDFIAFNKQCSTAFSDLDTIAAMLEKDNCDEADYRYMENTLRQIAMFHMIFADIINIDTISHDITDGVDVFLPKLNNFNHQQKAMEAQLVLEYKSQLLNKMQS